MPTRVRFAAIILAIVYAVLAAWFPLSKASAAPGALDTTFAATGTVRTSIGTGDDTCLNMALAPDGKIVAVGYSNNGSNIDVALVRYNPDGTLDTSFNGTGKVTTPTGSGDDAAGAVAVQNDGKILIAGSAFTGTNQDILVARYNPNGTLDTTFNGTGRVTVAIAANDYGDGVVIQSDGKIVVLAHSYNGSRIDLVLLRFNPNGTPDLTFDGDGKVITNFGSQDIGHAITLQPIPGQAEQKILVTGLTGPGNNAYSLELVRYLPNGTLDTGFNGTGRITTVLRTGNNYGNGVTVMPDNRILVAGLAGTSPDYDVALVRFTENGTLDTTFGGGTGKVTTPVGSADDSANGVKLQSDGKIVVAGSSNIAGNNDFLVVRYNPDGTLDSSFNGTGKLTTAIGGGDDTGVALALQEDGKIVLAGYTHNGSNYDIAVARYLVSPPDAVTAAATGVNVSQATLNGSVNPKASATIALFEYGLTTSYGTSVTVPVSPGSSSVPVSAPISGLQANQTYHYRLTATNPVGTTNGADMTFTTGAVGPTVVTGTASNVTSNGATISGSVNPNGSLVSSALVEYGLTTSYGATANVLPAPGSGTSAVAVSATLSGLQPLQTYHFRISATNQTATSTGQDGTFTTGAAAPIVTTGASSNVSATGATLSGTVNPNGQATTATFEFGLTTSYGSIVNGAPNPGSATAPVNVTALLSGLTPNRTYHYRLTATNAGGFTTGADATFSTSASLPTVLTQAATAVTTTGATFHGVVNPNGSNTKVRFFYGLAGTSLNSFTDYTSVGSGTSDVPVSIAVSGLTPFTDYECRLDAEADGLPTRNGNVVSFKTLVSSLNLLPDRAFATLGGAAFDIDVLENDRGDGLTITGLAPGFPTGRVVINGTQLNFTPREISASPESAPEIFGYQVSDTAQNQADALVTVYYFLASRGTYFGSFSEVLGQRVLRIRLDLDYAGLASGRLEWEDEQYPFKVQFDSSGRAQIAKARAGDNNVSLVADLQIDPIAETITGSFRDMGLIPTTINPTLQFLPQDPERIPSKGIQIAFIDPGEQGAGSFASALAEGADTRPEGIGFTQLKVGKKGLGRFITKMPDFGAFSAGKQLDSSGAVELPRYRLENILYKRAGAGKLGFVSGDTFATRDNVDNDRIAGALTWQRLRSGGGSDNLIALLEGFQYKGWQTGYPSGFTDQNPNATMLLSGGGLESDYAFDLFIQNARGRLTGSTNDPVAQNLNMTLKFNVLAGLFNGSFDFPSTQEKVKVMGGIGIEPRFNTGLALPQSLMRGSFLVQSTGRTGRVTIKKK